MLYTYGFADKERDLMDLLYTIIKDEPRFISCFRPGEHCFSTKHTWQEDDIAPRGIVALGVSASGLVVEASEFDISKLKVGVLLTINNDTALFRVDDLISGTKFSVSLAAANGSFSKVIYAGAKLNIISCPLKEGSRFEIGAGFTEWNATQIFRKDIILSGSEIPVGIRGGVDNQLNSKTALALADFARDLNRVALFGRRVNACRGEAGGLYFFGTQPGALAIDASGARLDSLLVDDAARAILSAGGAPTQILCSPGQARVLSNQYKDQFQIVRSDDCRGAYVAVIVNEVNGCGLTIIADPDMPDGDAWIIDATGFYIAPLRELADADCTPRDFDGIRRIARGEITLEFKNAKQRLCRIRGLKPSREVLGNRPQE